MASKTARRFAAEIAPHLAPGEQMQEAFIAQTLSGWWAVISMWIILFSGGYRVVVATDRRLLVFDRAKFKTRLGPLKRELPRGTRIGPTKGLWYRTDVLGEKLYISRVLRSRVEAIDAAIGA